MKKIIFSLLMTLCVVAGFAQQNPNRMVVFEKDGVFRGYLVERIDSVIFPKVEGEVKAALECTGVNMDKLAIIVNVTRTPECAGFKIGVIPTVTANRLSDMGVIDYVSNSGTSFYFQDFTAGELTNDSDPIEYDTEYTVVTVGYDQYKTPCAVERANIKTPKKDLVGAPEVKIDVKDEGGRGFTAHFTPNADVKEYYVLAMEPDKFEEQYNMFAPMMGFKNHGDMIKGFGAKFDKESEFTWDELMPATKYRVYVQSLDAAGTYGEVNTADVTTATLGGPGAATVEIKLGAYKLEEWNDNGAIVKAPTQHILFTPNDQTMYFRYAVYTKAVFDAEKDNIMNGMKETGYDVYEAQEDAFMVEANADYVAVAVAKNANGEWGEFALLPFTTADAPQAEKVVVKAGKLNGRAVEAETPLFVPGRGLAVKGKMSAGAVLK